MKSRLILKYLVTMLRAAKGVPPVLLYRVLSQQGGLGIRVKSDVGRGGGDQCGSVIITGTDPLYDSLKPVSPPLPPASFQLLQIDTVIQGIGS